MRNTLPGRRSERRTSLLFLCLSLVNTRFSLVEAHHWTKKHFLSLSLCISLSLSLLFLFVMLQHHGNCFRSEHLDTSIWIDRITSSMLSYLQPQLTSESMLAICSTSSDELTKSIYHQDDEHEGIFNPASSSRLAYPQAQHHKSPVPFVYGHTPTPSYGFGFGFYDDMSSFAGKTSIESEDSFSHCWI